MTPSIAGSRVPAAMTLIRTITAAAMPTPLRNDRPSTSMPSMATQTVAPAKMTARPEVLRARTADSSGLRPALSPLRCRVTMNSA